MNIVDRFFSYVSIDTTSSNETGTTPSTEGQLILAKMLCKELTEIGLTEVNLSEYGYVTATLPATQGYEDEPVIGFIAHMDTSPDASGKNIKPRIVKNYDGKNILLNEEKQLYLRTELSPEIKKYLGEDLIVTDGTTLLGADDKAGIAAIVTAMENLMKDTSIPHGKVRICFTPDEEIGEGADHFDIEGFGADFAYTVDGGRLGEIEYECFNAASAVVRLRGRNVHPGYAKGKMLNAITLGMEFANLIPPTEVPEVTQKREGFFHLNNLDGNVETCTLYYLIRDHSEEAFKERIRKMEVAADFMNKKYNRTVCVVTFREQYRNMKEKIAPQMHIVERAKNAMRELGLRPKERSIRGGSDGAKLSFMGLPCPNIFMGGHNFHSRMEYLPIKSLELCEKMIINIIKTNK